jgi:hypothetical protein
MSRRHPWLRFTTDGPQLPRGLRTNTLDWQRSLTALHARWYDGVAPPQVGSAFVLQWLLQVPAHAAALAAATGPWRAALSELTFSLSPSQVPDVVRLTSLRPDHAPLIARLAAAERDYRIVALPLAHGVETAVRIGPHTRAAMVDDMWAQARQAAAETVGAAPTGVLPRRSCCLIYALPGCLECAGCPRLRGAPVRR